MTRVLSQVGRREGMGLLFMTHKNSHEHAFHSHSERANEHSPEPVIISVPNGRSGLFIPRPERQNMHAGGGIGHGRGERNPCAHATNKRTSAINIQIRVRRAGRPSHSLHPIHGNAVSSSQRRDWKCLKMRKRLLFLPNAKQMQRKSVVNVNSVAGRSPSGGSCVIHRFSRESWQNLRGTHPT